MTHYVNPAGELFILRRQNTIDKFAVLDQPACNEDGIAIANTRTYGWQLGVNLGKKDPKLASENGMSINTPSVQSPGPLY